MQQLNYFSTSFVFFLQLGACFPFLYIDAMLFKAVRARLLLQRNKGRRTCKSSHTRSPSVHAGPGWCMHEKQRRDLWKHASPPSPPRMLWESTCSEACRSRRNFTMHAVTPWVSLCLFECVKECTARLSIHSVPDFLRHRNGTFLCFFFQLED